MNSLEELLEIKYKLNQYSTDQISDAIDMVLTPLHKTMLSKYLDMKDSWDSIRRDITNNTYKEWSEESIEKYRKEMLTVIEGLDNPVKKVNLLMEVAKQIEEYSSFTNFRNVFYESSKVFFMIEVCKNMLIAGATLTEITKYVPDTALGDIYHFGKDYLGLQIPLTDEERAQVEAYDKKEMLESEKKVTFSEILSFNRQLEGLPFLDNESSLWKIYDDTDMKYTTKDIVKKYTNCSLLYPYYLSGQHLKYTESFEDLLEVVLKKYTDIGFEGLEKYYSSQEMNMLLQLRDSLLQIWNS